MPGSGGLRADIFVTNIQPINIPTELLRTLIAVVDLRSFTKAAQSLGVTQPAVSAQIKRLQVLLGIELFDKSAPGVTITEKGELVVNYARRILAINDQILGLVVPRTQAPILHMGIPADFAASALPKAIAAFQASAPHLRFQLRGEGSENLLRDLRQGQLDLVIALTTSGPALDARHYWREDVVWIRGPGTMVEGSGPLSLVTLREGGLLHRVTTSMLNQANRDYEVVFTAFSAVGLLAAVSAGLGLALLPRREVSADVVICDDAFLPKPPEIYCGIYLRDGIDCEVLEALADAIAEALAPPSGGAGPVEELNPFAAPAGADPSRR